MIPNLKNAYQPLPDQAARAAEYRTYWMLGKAILFLMTAVSFLVAGGIVSSMGSSVWWLFFIPLIFVVALIKPGFPAFCRCPQCKKKMKNKEMNGRTPETYRRYLVCKQCQLSVFLGEYGTGGND